MKLAVVFPGQGSQGVGMGKDLYDNVDVARATYEEANEALGYSLSEVCFNGPAEKLNTTSVTQPAILTTSIVLFNEFIKLTPAKISSMAGHSLGEYTALVASGSLKFKEAVTLVEKRGLLMEKAVANTQGGMAAVLGLDRNLVAGCCEQARTEGTIEVANYNCPGQVVISGSQTALQKACDLCKEAGAKMVVPLSVSGPFHSSLMAPVEEELRVELDKVGLQKPQFPILSNVNANYVTDPAELQELLVKQVSHSVLWEDIIQKMIADGVDTFVEVGPGKVLTGLIKKINRGVMLLNISDQNSLENTLAKLKEVI